MAFENTIAAFRDAARFFFERLKGQDAGLAHAQKLVADAAAKEAQAAADGFFAKINKTMRALAQANKNVAETFGNESAVAVDTIAVALTDIHGKPVSGTDIHGNTLTVPSQENLKAALGGEDIDGVFYKLTTAERYFKETKNADGSVTRVEISEADFKKGQAAEQAYKEVLEAKAGAKPPEKVEVPDNKEKFELDIPLLRIHGTKFKGQEKRDFDAVVGVLDQITKAESLKDLENLQKYLAAYREHLDQYEGEPERHKASKIDEIVELKQKELEAKAAAAAAVAAAEAKATDYDPNVTYGVVSAPVLLVSTKPFASVETAEASQSLEQIGSRLGGKKVKQASLENIDAMTVGCIDLSGVQPVEPKGRRARAKKALTKG